MLLEKLSCMVRVILRWRSVSCRGLRGAPDDMRDPDSPAPAWCLAARPFVLALLSSLAQICDIDAALIDRLVDFSNRQ